MGKRFMAVGLETTYGTAVSAHASGGLNIVNETIAPDNGMIDVPNVGYRTTPKRVAGPYSLGGTVNFVGDPNELSWYLTFALGTRAQTGAGPYTHAITPAVMNLPSFTAYAAPAVPKTAGSTNYNKRRMVGGFCRSLTLQANARDILTGNMDVNFQKDDLIYDNQTITFSTLDPLVFQQGALYVGVNYAGTSSALGNVGGTTVIDTTRTEANDTFNGMYLLLLSGTYAGQYRLISDWDLASGTFTTAAFGGQIAASTLYVVYPATASSNIESFSTTIANDVATDAYVIGSRFLPAVRTQGLTVTGEFDLAMADWNIYKRFYDGVGTASIAQDATSTPIAASTIMLRFLTTSYSATIVIPKVYLDTTRASFDRRNRMVQNVSFTGVHDSKPNLAIAAIVINGISMA